MEEIIYNPIVNKKPLGPIKIGEEVTFNLKIRADYLISKVTLVLRYEKDNSINYLIGYLVGYETNYFCYEIKTSLKEYGLYWYHFEVETNKGILFVNKSEKYLACLNSEEEFPLTVIKKEIKVEKEYQGGIIYQIFVDRFNRVGEINLREGFVYRDDWGGRITKNTSDRTKLNYEVFGGNLKGIIARLDYLESLGVTTIYLSPIFLAPSNHKYDTSDYSKIDPMYGDKQDLQNLIDLAKKRKMGIVLDGVFNHTGSDSIYFNKEKHFSTLGAYNSKESPYYDWYDFNEWPDDYRCWWGIKTLPAVKQTNKELQQYLSEIIEGYMQMGLQGFRLDVVDEIHHELLTKICESIYKVKKDAIVIGEVWEDASIKIAYGIRRKYFIGEELNSVMNYPLKDALLEYVINEDESKFYYVYQMIEDNYPEFVKHNLMNLIGSHDTKRIISILKEKEDYLSLLKIISGLQFTFYGLPSIFYGDEVGLEGDDPDFSRTCFPYGKENKDVEKWYQTLTKIRKHKVFKQGKMVMIKCEEKVIAFKRVDKDEEILVIANLNKETYIYQDGFKYKSLLDKRIKKLIEVNYKEIDILIKKEK